MSSALIITASGRWFDILRPDPEDVNFVAMGEQLAKQARWLGATPGMTISIAEHSVRVERMLPPRAKPYGLLHDGHEYVIGDHARPVQAAFEAVIPGFKAARDRLIGPIDAAIHSAAGLPWPPPPDIASAVREADDAILATERHWLFPAETQKYRTAEIQASFKPLPTWHGAYELFMASLRQLLPHVLP